MGHSSGGRALRCGVVQITCTSCSVLFCLPARWRCPQLKGYNDPGKRRPAGVTDTLKVSTWPSPARVGDPAREQGRNCSPAPGCAQVALEVLLCLHSCCISAAAHNQARAARQGWPCCLPAPVTDPLHMGRRAQPGLLLQLRLGW